ncbi:MAG: carbamoyltransferase HypF, partial [Rhodoferax sp.]|nr:carbamoyltransferase HypF [Rhodoferax sp.]
MNTVARILACGAFLKNAACLLDTEAPGAPLWSVLHGDLSDPAACESLEQS